LVEKLPSSGTNTYENYLTKSIKNTIFCYPTDIYEISSLIRKLKDNKSHGPDNVGPTGWPKKVSHNQLKKSY